MAHHSAPDSSAPHAVEAQEPTPVSDDKWVRTVQIFTRSLGPPDFLKSGNPVPTAQEADEAKWGNNETGVDLIRGEHFAPVGNSIFLQADSMTDFDALIGDFKCLGLTVKDPVTRIVGYRNARFGSAIKKENITFGSFYLNEDKADLNKSDVVGVLDVGHNPPPPGRHPSEE